MIEDLTCAQTLCVAVGSGGEAFASTDPTGGRSAWNTDLVAGVDPLSAIACSRASLCAAVDVSGHAFTTSTPRAGRAAWQLATLDSGHRLTAVTCTGRLLCVAVDAVGDAFTRAGGRWRRASIDHGRRLTGVACPSARLCVAVDAKGGVLSSTDPAGGARRWHRVVVGGSFQTLSCPTIHFCAAQGTKRIAVTADATGGASAWTERHPATAVQLFAVSCSPDGQCVALANEGGLLAGLADLGRPARFLTALEVRRHRGLHVHPEQRGLALLRHVRVLPTRGRSLAWRCGSHVRRSFGVPPSARLVHPSQRVVADAGRALPA